MADITAERATTRTIEPATWSHVLVWALCALALVVAPYIFNSGASVSFLSQLGTLIIFCLSYNMLLGQGGMFSFGHAVYSGLGSYFAIHAMNSAAGGSINIPIWLVPLLGGLAGMIFGVLFGYLTTRKAGTAFAMITLGMGELVHSFSLMFPGFFGGEGGITADRSYGTSFFGLTFGPQIQVYYLIAAWLMLCAIGMYAFTQTPLGRIGTAVRDNAERAEFIGYDPKTVRFFVLVISGFFAGISGGLTAINSELVTSESVSAARSADALMFTFIGGSSFFFGPVVGVVIGGFLALKLSDFTPAWQLYLGLFFVLFVMYAPGGMTGIFAANWRILRAGMFGRVLPSWLAVVASTALIAIGAIALIELSYSFVFGSQKGLVAHYAKSLDPRSYAALWAACILVFVAGIFLFKRCAPRFNRDWDEVSAAVSLANPKGAA